MRRVEQSAARKKLMWMKRWRSIGAPHWYGIIQQSQRRTRNTPPMSKAQAMVMSAHIDD